jgi:hypothetical protein
LIPPPPGSRRAGAQRSFRVGWTRSTEVEMSMAGFIVIVST